MQLSLILVLLLSATPLLAGEVCFAEADASKMVVELERGRICEQQVVHYEKATQELTEQINLLQEQVNMMSKKFDETLKQLEVERKLAEEKDKARIEEIKQAGKPQWTMLFGGFSAGAVLIGALFLFL
jgi:peptidoglycan hydrolase CwlO-like protein